MDLALVSLLLGGFLFFVGLLFIFGTVIVPPPKTAKGQEQFELVGNIAIMLIVLGILFGIIGFIAF